MEAKKIMVCDDDQGVLDVIEMMLDSSGYTAFTEINSTNLISEIKKNQPDLILLDLWMPVLSGDQVVRAIRADQNISHLPVIILSASRDGDDIAMDAGADAFLSKPFDMDELIDTIEDLLKNKQGSISL
ncbi:MULTISPECIES: response regulator [Chryseobacterium]|uniref:CheY-like chemotaxis protein n=1 Tax=Chryseobacterium camelliae TaxID=1265445 RepID=A0ABU0TFU0_9FLAO|nr:MULTISPECIES: response regulator [Chryseobacterium]MDT3406279.1 CheY-like chemotaxis protein [Pseudacidovorax intermedius]MDQ1095923.1 CheY-like chemotaxis protein [Chryseobacterium camelliae]MDQ1099859.1 CheY-like chemotaxis protein [Chryseobacterium sp. SORGH_AS_1048]MDR6087205.1 CheY-like chemotaxis protein [Chryseobacterium sp. SORGH_AS_0909]MDR6131579.1 CheY-like chemotaxis protein [Chryseobacterium sp. SORGH_AS_1175]